MSKKFWSTDKIVSISAISISVLSLYFFIKQTALMDKQSRLSAMPYLVVETSENGFDNELIISIHNYGVGPAIINKMVVHYEGKKYETDLQHFIQEIIPYTDSLNTLSSASLDKGLAIPTNGERVLLKMGGTKAQFEYCLYKMFEIIEGGFDYDIYYQSIYEDKWKISASNEIPEKLN